MCRHAAAIGPPAPLRFLLFDGAHSMLRQSYAARELLTGVVCADGFGVGWYDADVRPEPARYARGVPIWSDSDLPGVAELVRSRCMMAAVRNATIAGNNHAANCAPFASGRYLLSHNGFLDDWDGLWRDEVCSWIAPERRRLVRGTTESEHLFQALLSALDGLDPEPGALATATKQVLQQVRQAAGGHGAAAQVNLLVTDGSQIVATRMSTVTPANSLYVCADVAAHPGTTAVASEPLTTDRWEPVAPDTLLVLQAGAPAVRMRC